MSEPGEQLRELLGEQPPPGIAALPAEDQARLSGLIAAAREKQQADLEAAFTATVRHVPFPVRGLAKKMLLG
jgi:hypothetical protein